MSGELQGVLGHAIMSMGHQRTKTGSRHSTRPPSPLHLDAGQVHDGIAAALAGPHRVGWADALQADHAARGLPRGRQQVLLHSLHALLQPVENLLFEGQSP